MCVIIQGIAVGPDLEYAAAASSPDTPEHLYIFVKDRMHDILPMLGTDSAVPKNELIKGIICFNIVSICSFFLIHTHLAHILRIGSHWHDLLPHIPPSPLGLRTFPGLVIYAPNLGRQSRNTRDWYRSRALRPRTRSRRLRALQVRSPPRIIEHVEYDLSYRPRGAFHKPG